ncbi:hypothetical protein AWC03_09865 [Mycobacterium europaeum]|uniref:hypothetical protein n=1 Tax=Mycobacterium europaeum TaxID=761804 RepID=UPI000A1635FA|nr:hypothetical protein [Mycobacterium europaeum]ORV61492.1 hypothetical protein AWC03_09865 [Mycobacterium europaeum]
MSTAHDDNAVSWRELADQLTPKQIAELEYCEREQIPPGVYSPQSQLNCARAMARHNITQALCADVPLPSDAAGDVAEWEEWQGGGHARMYTCSVRTAGTFSVEIVGIQHDDDGRVERFILAQDTARDGSMTAANAREFAALLVDAADELDSLSAGGAR